MSRRLPSLVALVTGALMVRLVSVHAHTRYVKPGAGWYLVAAGVVLVVAGGLGLASAQTREHAPPRVAALLLVPLALLVVVAPPSLGAAYVHQASNTATASGRGSYAPIVVEADGTARPSLAQVVNRAAVGDDLSGPLVRLLGFVGGTDEQGRPLLTRFSVKCCAADATVSQVALQDAGRPHPDSWLEVVGRIVSPRGARPVLQVKDSHEVEAPADPYES